MSKETPQSRPDESQPLMPGFSLVEGDTPPDLDVIAAQIADSRKGRDLVGQPDATDRWLEEVGAGPRRDSLAADPPSRPKGVDGMHPRKPIGRSLGEISGRDVGLEMAKADLDKEDPDGSRLPVLPEADYWVARAKTGMAEDARRAQGDPRYEVAYNASRDGHRPK